MEIDYVLLLHDLWLGLGEQPLPVAEPATPHLEVNAPSSDIFGNRNYSRWSYRLLLKVSLDR